LLIYNKLNIHLSINTVFLSNYWIPDVVSYVLVKSLFTTRKLRHLLYNPKNLITFFSGIFNCRLINLCKINSCIFRKLRGQNFEIFINVNEIVNYVKHIQCPWHFRSWRRSIIFLAGYWDNLFFNLNQIVIRFDVYIDICPCPFKGNKHQRKDNYKADLSKDWFPLFQISFR